MKASTSSIIQNRCYPTINSNAHQNGYAKDGTNLIKLNDIESKRFIHNQYIPNYYDQNQQTSAQTFSFKENSIKHQTKSLMELNNNKTNNNSNDILPTLSTPTKETEDYYTALVKPSLTYLTTANNNKNEWCDSTYVHSTINNDATQTDTKVLPFCIQLLHQNMNNQQKTSSFGQNNQDYLCDK